MPQPFHIDLYWSFRSPYSYLILPRVNGLHAVGGHAVQWHVRVVYPLAIRYPQHFVKQAENPLARPYFLRDCERTARMLGMPFRRPVPDPIVQDPVTLAIADHQPHIHHLAHLGVAAVRRGHGLAFITEVSRLLWDGTTDHWHQGDHLAQATARAGLRLIDLEADIAADRDGIDAEIARNQDDQQAAGHWGVPLLVFQGEPYFGQDRFDALLWHLHHAAAQSHRHPTPTP